MRPKEAPCFGGPLDGQAFSTRQTLLRIPEIRWDPERDTLVREPDEAYILVDTDRGFLFMWHTIFERRQGGA